MDLVFVRHGECGTSSVDDVLTPLGEWQAQQIGKRLADVPVTALLSSPLLRALVLPASLRTSLEIAFLRYGQSFAKDSMAHIKVMEVWITPRHQSGLKSTMEH